MRNNSKISLRKVNFSDIEFLWYLRNQPDVYRYSIRNRPVEWREHINWLMPIILELEPKDLFIIKKNSLPIGQIRVDYNNKDKQARISIAVLKEFRRKGIATDALKRSIKSLKKDNRVKNIIVEVYKDNISSRKFFEKLNFKLKEKRGEWLKYILEV